LKRSTKDDTADVGGLIPERSGKANSPSGPEALLRNNGLLVFSVGDNLSKLELDVLGVSGLTTEPSEHLSSLLDVSVLNIEPGGIGKEEQSDTKDKTPSELDTDGDPVGTAIVAPLGGVGDARGEEDTDGDTELVARDEGTSNFTGADLGHVQNDDGRDKSDSDTSNDTTKNNQGKSGSLGSLSGSLNDDTSHVDNASPNDDDPSSELVSQVTSNERTKESTSREDRGNQRVVRGRQSSGVRSLNEVLEDSRSSDTIDVTGIVSEEDTSKGCEGAKKVRLNSNRGLDPVKVGGTSDDSTTRHFDNSLLNLNHEGE
jgi:hypothetical protein